MRKNGRKKQRQVYLIQKNKISDLTEQIFSIKSGLSNDTNRKKPFGKFANRIRGLSVCCQKTLTRCKAKQ